MNIQWLVATGDNWVILDRTSQEQIEILWANATSGWIECRTFSGPVYVDFQGMTLSSQDLMYTIARRAA